MWALVVDGDCGFLRLAGSLFTSKCLESALVLLDARDLFPAVVCAGCVDTFQKTHAFGILRNLVPWVP